MLFVLTFHTTHDALSAAAACAAASIPHEKIPTPRVLSSECGFAVQAGPVDETALTNLIQQHPLRHEAVYRVTQENATCTYTRCDCGGTT
jgi:hypothetical protein